MKLKRLLAYILDFIIISILASLVFSLPMFKNSYKGYYNTTNDVLERLQDSKFSDEELITMSYDIYKSSSNLNIIKISITFLYFGVVSYLWKGKTIGKKVFHLRVKPIKGDNLNPGLYILRSIIVTNMIFEIVSVFGLILLKKSTWLSLNSVVGAIEIVISLLILFVMIFREDGRSIHDFIGKTIVVEEKKE